MARSLVDVSLTPAFSASVAFDPTLVSSVDSTTDFAKSHGDWRMVGLRLTEGLSELFRADLWMARFEGVRPAPPPKPPDFWDRTRNRVDSVDNANQAAANAWKNVQNATNQNPTGMPGGPQAYANNVANQIAGYTGAANNLLNTGLNQGQNEVGDALNSFNPSNIRKEVLGEVPEQVWNGTRPPNPAEFVGSMRSLRLMREGSEVLPHGRWITGLVHEFEDLGVLANGWRVVRIALVPELYKLSLRSNCRVFQDLTALEIVLAVIKDAKIYPQGISISDRIVRVLPKREYCVQYDETDLAFVRRLIAQEGLVFGFEHHERAERFCIYEGAEIAGADLTAIEHHNVKSELPLAADKERRDNEEVCWDISLTIGLPSTRTRERAVHFSAPKQLLDQQDPAAGKTGLDRTVDERDHAAQLGEIEAWPGDLAFTGDGEAGYLEASPQRPASQLRLERTQMQGRVMRATTNATAALPGQRVSITGSLDAAQYDPLARAGGSLRILRTQHLLLRDEPDRLGGAKPKEAGLPADVIGVDNYSNTLELYPSTLPVRIAGPPRPRIEGLQTAIVVSPQTASTEQPSHLCLDAMGRVLLRFYWDRRLAAADWMSEKDVHSCWARVAQPWAGAGWGTSFHPRIGMEVVVAFEDGDPDRPVVVGMVHDRQNPFPRERKHITHEGENVLPLKEDKRLHYKKDAVHGNDDAKHLAMIRTASHPPPPSGQRQGYNELSFDDAADHQRIRMHAEGVLIEHVLHDHTTKVDQDQINVVQGNQTEHIGTGEGDDAGKQTLHVKGTRTKEIVGHEHTEIGGDRNERIYGQETIEIDGYRAEKVLQHEHVQIGREEGTGTSFRELKVKGSRSTRVHGHDRLEVGGDRKLIVIGNYKASGNPLTMQARAPAAAPGAPPASEIATGDGTLRMTAKGDPGKLDLIARGEQQEGSVDLLARNVDGTGDPPAIQIESKGKRIRFVAGDVSLTMSEDGLHLKAPRGIMLGTSKTMLTLGPAVADGKVLHHNLVFFSVNRGADGTADPPDGAVKAPEPDRPDARVAYFGGRSSGMAGKLPKRELPPVPEGYDISKDPDLRHADLTAQLENTGIQEPQQNEDDKDKQKEQFTENGLFITANNVFVDAVQLVVLSEKGVNLQQTKEDGSIEATMRLLSDDEQDLLKKLDELQKKLNDALLAYKKAEHEYQQAMKDNEKASKEFEKAFAEVSKLTNIYQGLKQKLDEHDRKLAEYEKKRQKAADALEKAKKREDSTTDPDADYQIAVDLIDDEKAQRKQTEDKQKQVGEEFDKAHDKYQRAKDKLEKTQKKTDDAKAKMEEAKAEHERLRDELLELKNQINRRTAPRGSG